MSTPTFDFRARVLARQVNEAAAAVGRRHPGRFAFFARPTMRAGNIRQTPRATANAHNLFQEVGASVGPDSSTEAFVDYSTG